MSKKPRDGRRRQLETPVVRADSTRRKAQRNGKTRRVRKAAAVVVRLHKPALRELARH